MTQAVPQSFRAHHSPVLVVAVLTLEVLRTLTAAMVVKTKMLVVPSTTLMLEV